MKSEESVKQNGRKSNEEWCECCIYVCQWAGVNVRKTRGITSEKDSRRCFEERQTERQIFWWFHQEQTQQPRGKSRYSLRGFPQHCQYSTKQTLTCTDNNLCTVSSSAALLPAAFAMCRDFICIYNLIRKDKEVRLFMCKSQRHKVSEGTATLIFYLRLYMHIVILILGSIYSWVRCPRYPFNLRLVEPQGRCGYSKRNLLHLSGMKPQILGCPVRRIDTKPTELSWFLYIT